MKSKLLATLAAGLISLFAPVTASALTLTAAGTGPITAYFYSQTAGYGSDIGLWVNGTFQGVYGLQNHLSAAGQSLVLGNANAGDSLVFELRVSTSNYYGPTSGSYSYSLFTNSALNPGNAEHAVSSVFGGGTFGIPAGIMLGFEDITPLSAGDQDYDDHRFVFTGVTTTPAPEGSTTLLLIGAALIGLVAFRRR